MTAELYSALDRLVTTLNKFGLVTEWYMIPSFTGYQALTGGVPSDVYCVEAYLGPSHDKLGYDAYAVAQSFLPAYPSLALIFLAELRKTDRQPSTTPPIFDIAIDRKFSTFFIPTMHTALNVLDPTGEQRGLLVQRYHSKMTLPNMLLVGRYSAKLLFQFKRDGQLAQIAVDYSDPLITLVANMIRPLMYLAHGDVHYIPRTSEKSSLKIPIRQADDSHFLIEDSSTALDKGFKLARTYLDNHYRMYGLSAGATIS